jgi:Cof subfamily protein (haloacid dehalogenase superfamily)
MGKKQVKEAGKMKKLVAIDIDSTLLNDERQITVAVREAIQRAIAQGVKIVITTGRPMPGVQPILDELGIQGPEQFVITYNGGWVQKADSSETIFKAPIAYEDYELVQTFADEQGAYLQVETPDAAHTVHHVINRWGSDENALVNLPLHVHEADELPRELDLIKAMITDETAFVDAVQKQVPATIQDRLTVIRSTAHNLEFINKTTSKGEALLRLADYLDIAHEETMAIGDQENDTTMIEMAGLGVAMGNAIEKLKKIAGDITTSNNENGVAVALQRHVLD